MLDLLAARDPTRFGTQRVDSKVTAKVEADRFDPSQLNDDELAAVQEHFDAADRLIKGAQERARAN